MNIGDRVYKIKTNAIYKVLNFNKKTGLYTLKRVISGGYSDSILEVNDLGGFKVYKIDENKIEFFDDDNSFLSNFYENDVVFEGITYPTNEHAFQAAKTLSEKEKLSIRQQKTPSRAKFKGRHVELRDNWENIKDDIMYQICKNKFTNNEELKTLLLKTNDKYLIEGNVWHDNHFGSCICANCRDEKKENILGEILMKIRTELK